MSIRNPLTADQLAERFTHHARCLGVPCYYNVETSDIHEANGVPGFLLDWALAVDGFLAWGASLLDPSHEPGFHLWLAAPIRGRRG